MTNPARALTLAVLVASAAQANPSFLGQGNDVPGSAAPAVVAPAGGATAPTSRVFMVGDTRMIRVRVGETFEQISIEAYGHPHNWWLIYYQNRALFEGSQPPPGGEVVLALPMSPRQRLQAQGNQGRLTVIPGDTFSAIAHELYGNVRLWPVPYEPNRNQLPNPAEPRMIFRHPPQQAYKYFQVPLRAPAPTQATQYPGQSGLPGGSSPGVTTAALPPSSSGVRPGPAGTTPPPNGAIPGPLGQLNITDPSQIGPREAALILDGTGFLDPRVVRRHTPPARNPTEAGLMALSWGSEYRRPRGRVPLNDEMKRRLFDQYRLMREALSRYGGAPEISARSHPQHYDAWVRNASSELTHVNPSEREALMRSLMTTESGRTQWRNHRPVVSYAGAVGFGQFLPATARGLNINPYDPQQNIQGIGRYVNQLIGQAKRRGLQGRQAVAWALAAYNGGTNFPRSSVAYAEGILDRLPGDGARVA